MKKITIFTTNHYARGHRNRSTKSEIHLWKCVLRASQTGYPFNRQRPVLNYIADFMCKPLKLIIEVDGASHDLLGAKKNDKIRQATLEMYGFTVIRFTNEQVLYDLDKVAHEIQMQIKKLEAKL